MAFACIHIPDFMLQSVVRSEPASRGSALASRGSALASPGSALAVLSGKPPLWSVVAANTAALQAGVQLGMTKSQVAEFCNVEIRHRSEAQEKAVHAALLDVAWSVSPRVEDTAADTIERAIAALPATRRITPASLHHSALRMRGATAPGPDGWSGDMVRRAARLFKRTLTDLLDRYFRALRDTRDPLLVHALLDAVMLAFLKPGHAQAATGTEPPRPNRFRPISIAGAFARCILAKAVTLSRKRLRDALDPLGQYALTSTPRPVADRRQSQPAHATAYRTLLRVPTSSTPSAQPARARC